MDGGGPIPAMRFRKIHTTHGLMRTSLLDQPTMHLRRACGRQRARGWEVSQSRALREAYGSFVMAWLDWPAGACLDRRGLMFGQGADEWSRWPYWLPSA